MIVSIGHVAHDKCVSCILSNKRMNTFLLNHYCMSDTSKSTLQMRMPKKYGIEYQCNRIKVNVTVA